MIGRHVTPTNIIILVWNSFGYLVMKLEQFLVLGALAYAAGLPEPPSRRKTYLIIKKGDTAVVPPGKTAIKSNMFIRFTFSIA